MRSILHLSLFLPALAGAALYTGTVSSLESHPLAGVVVKLGSDSVVTGLDGTWSLSRTAGIQSRNPLAIDGTRHLVRDGSRISLTWQDHDILGKGQAMRNSLPSNPRTSTSGRKMSTSAADTIVIRWKGRNLSRIPVPASDTTIAQAIDTSWKDDAGIPWNPRITYGSLPDTRDSQTYRTVKIGTQTWMAENLNYRNTTGAKDTAGVCFMDSTDNCGMFGRLYLIKEALDSHVSSATIPSGVQGICLSGWHVPSDSEWTTLLSFIGGSSESIKLRSTTHWSPLYHAEDDSFHSRNGTDDFGFRALPGGGAFSHSFWLNGLLGYWWSTTEDSSVNSYYLVMICDGSCTSGFFDTMGIYGTGYEFSLRCLED